MGPKPSGEGMLSFDLGISQDTTDPTKDENFDVSEGKKGQGVSVPTPVRKSLRRGGSSTHGFGGTSEDVVSDEPGSKRPRRRGKRPIGEANDDSDDDNAKEFDDDVEDDKESDDEVSDDLLHDGDNAELAESTQDWILFNTEPMRKDLRFACSTNTEIKKLLSSKLTREEFRMFSNTCFRLYLNIPDMSHQGVIHRCIRE